MWEKFWFSIKEEIQDHQITPVPPATCIWNNALWKQCTTTLQKVNTEDTKLELLRIVPGRFNYVLKISLHSAFKKDFFKISFQKKLQPKNLLNLYLVGVLKLIKSPRLLQQLVFSLRVFRKWKDCTRTKNAPKIEWKINMKGTY